MRNSSIIMYTTEDGSQMRFVYDMQFPVTPFRGHAVCAHDLIIHHIHSFLQAAAGRLAFISSIAQSVCFLQPNLREKP